MKKYLISWMVILSLVIAIGFSFNKPQLAEGSVSQGGQYQSIETGPTNTNTNIFQSTVVASSSGVLGSVILTQPSSGGLILYDATTSNVTLRSGATTTLKILAQFMGGQATSTYTFDESYFNGLVVEFTGNVATSTITWRSY